MLESDFLIDMLSILELKIAEWNEMVEKQQTWIDTHISTAEEMINSDIKKITSE